MIKIILSLISAGLLIYLGVTLENSIVISMLAAVPVLYAGKIVKSWILQNLSKFLFCGM
jgi:hypothetical protein